MVTQNIRCVLTTSIVDQITVAPRQPSPYTAAEMEIGVSQRREVASKESR